jgi:carboxyl-terminal processing protease
MKNKYIYTLVIFFFISTFSNNAISKDKKTYEYLDLFGQIFDRVRSSYVDDITDEELIEKAIDGMLTGLDPHSGYMNEKVWKEMQMDTQGKFGGLGIEITMEEGFVKVISPIDDSPAFKLGILAGDFITKINDTLVFGLTLSEAVDLMRGEKGSAIKITISRKNMEPFELEIVRDVIKVQSVKYEIFENIGYLRITSFSEQTESGIKKSVKKIKDILENKEMGYILDIRNNPGGLLSQAVAVSDIFLEQGEIVSTRGRTNIDMKRYRAKKGDLIDGKPLIIIINAGSASASEIVAGALQDHKRAVIIGTKSFGKGSVQTIIPFKKSNNKMAGIRLTTARYYTPSGKSIQGKGIDPDINIEQGVFEADDYNTYSESDLIGSLENENNITLEDSDNEDTIKKERIKNDYQLSRAIDLIKAMSIFKE